MLSLTVDMMRGPNSFRGEKWVFPNQPAEILVLGWGTVSEEDTDHSSGTTRSLDCGFLDLSFFRKRSNTSARNHARLQGRFCPQTLPSAAVACACRHLCCFELEGNNSSNFQANFLLICKIPSISLSLRSHQSCHCHLYLIKIQTVWWIVERFII